MWELVTSYEKVEKEADEQGKKGAAVDLWIAVRGFVHAGAVQELGPWMMLEDGDRCTNTAALLGIAFCTSLNAVERSDLLAQPGPIKDLGLGVALMGRFGLGRASLVGEVPRPGGVGSCGGRMAECAGALCARRRCYGLRRLRDREEICGEVSCRGGGGVEG